MSQINNFIRDYNRHIGIPTRTVAVLTKNNAGVQLIGTGKFSRDFIWYSIHFNGCEVPYSISKLAHKYELEWTADPGFGSVFILTELGEDIILYPKSTEPVTIKWTPGIPGFAMDCSGQHLKAIPLNTVVYNKYGNQVTNWDLSMIFKKDTLEETLTELNKKNFLGVSDWQYPQSNMYYSSTLKLKLYDI